jgi:hypothetical protein
MYGNIKYNHAIMLIQVHNLGKEGQCEFCRIYQNFVNKFGSQINSNQVQKQFCFQNFKSNFVSNVNFIPKGKMFLIFQSSHIQNMGFF